MCLLLLEEDKYWGGANSTNLSIDQSILLFTGLHMFDPISSWVGPPPPISTHMSKVYITSRGHTIIHVLTYLTYLYE